MKISELIDNMPELDRSPWICQCNKCNSKMGHPSTNIRNITIKQIGKIEIPPEKLLGMVEIDQRELTCIASQNLITHPITGHISVNIERFIKAIATNKSKILKVNK